MEIRTMGPFLDYWSKIRARTERVARCIPPERLEWSYREGKFTFGDTLRHLGALERFMFAENAAGRQSSYPGHGRELAEGYDEVLAYLERCHRETLDILRALPDERLEEYCTTPGGGRLRVWKWLRAMIEHEAHHRGQVYLFLAMLDIETPPLYGLTSEEVRERSTQR